MTDQKAILGTQPYPDTHPHKWGHIRRQTITGIQVLWALFNVDHDEVERRNQRGSGGKGHLAIEQGNLFSGFIGGMA